VRWIVAVAFLFLSLPAFGQSGLSIGRLGYGGTGCPDGTAQAILTSSGKIRLLFTSFQARASGGNSFDRVSCDIAIPVSVPAGRSISLLSVGYYGYNRLPAGADSRLNVETFFAGGTGPTFERNFDGPLSRAFSLSETYVATWSACGEDVNLRAHASLLVNTTGGRTASMGILAQDVQAGLVYTFQVRNC
jgi:hypothetical protein